jgi:hypothetical protein
MKGAGFALGRAIMAYLVAPVPGSAEMGAKLGSKLGALAGGGSSLMERTTAARSGGYPMLEATT